MEHFVSEDDLLEMLVDRKVDFISSLPIELLELCLDSIEPFEIIRNIFRLSKRFFSIGKDSIFWRGLFESAFEVSPLSKVELAFSLPLTFERSTGDRSPGKRLNVQLPSKLNVNENINWRDEFKRRHLWHKKFSDRKLKAFSSSMGNFSLVSVVGDYVAAYDGTDSITLDLVQIWDLDKAKNKPISTGHENQPTCVKLTNSHVAIGTSNGEVSVYNVLNQNLSFTLPPPDQFVDVRVTALDMVGHRFIAVGYSSGQVSLWDLGSAKIPIRSGGHSKPVELIYIFESLNRVISLANKEIVIWDGGTGSLQAKLLLSPVLNPIQSIIYSRLLSYSPIAETEFQLIWHSTDLNLDNARDYAVFDCITLDPKVGLISTQKISCDFLDPPFSSRVFSWQNYIISWFTEFNLSEDYKQVFYLELRDIKNNELLWRKNNVLGHFSRLIYNYDELKLKVLYDSIFVVLAGYLVGIWTLKEGKNMLVEPINVARGITSFRDFFPYENGIVVHLTSRIEFYEWEKQHFVPSPKTQMRYLFTVNDSKDELEGSKSRIRESEEGSVDLFEEDPMEVERPAVSLASAHTNSLKTIREFNDEEPTTEDRPVKRPRREKDSKR